MRKPPTAIGPTVIQFVQAAVVLGGMRTAKEIYAASGLKLSGPLRQAGARLAHRACGFGLMVRADDGLPARYSVDPGWQAIVQSRLAPTKPEKPKPPEGADLCSIDQIVARMGPLFTAWMPSKFTEGTPS